MGDLYPAKPATRGSSGVTKERRLDELPVDLADLPADIAEKVERRAGRVEARLTIGRYMIVGEIGRGGMGLVYECWDPRIERRVAVKTIEPDVVPDEQEREEVIERFLRETKVVGRLRNPGIVTIYDYGEDPELQRGEDPFEPGRTYFYVMEYLRGKSLSRLLKDRHVLPDVEAVAVAVDVADALAVAHDEGIIHRDIKPSNIFIRDTKQAVLLDFGIAKTSSHALTRQGQILGTPSYLAPERLREKERPLDGRADLFSLGVLLYTMLVGEAPFVGDNVYDLIDNIAKKDHPRLDRATPGGVALSSVLDRLLAKSPDDRFATAPEAASRLRDVLEQLRDSTPDVSDLAASVVPSGDAMEGATEVASPSGPMAVPVSRVEPSGTKPEVRLHRRTRQIPVKGGGAVEYQAGYPSPQVYEARDLEELEDEDVQLLDDGDPATNDIPSAAPAERTRVDGPRVDEIPEPQTLGIDDEDEDITKEPGEIARDDRAVTPKGGGMWDLEPEHEPTKEAPVRRFASVSEDETIADPDGLDGGAFGPNETLTGDHHPTPEVQTDGEGIKLPALPAAPPRNRPRPRIQASLVDEADVIVKPSALDDLGPEELPTQTAVPSTSAPDPIIGKPYDPLETEVVRTRGLPKVDPADGPADPAERRERPPPKRRSSTPLLRRRKAAPTGSAAVVRRTIGVQKPSNGQTPPPPNIEGYVDIQVSGADLDEEHDRGRLARNRMVILLGAGAFAVSIGLLLGRMQHERAPEGDDLPPIPAVPALTAKPAEPPPPPLVPPRSPEAILEDANAALEANLLVEADRLYSKARDAAAAGSDVHVVALLGRARTMTKAGAKSEAKSLYTQLLELRESGPVADEARAALGASEPTPEPKRKPKPKSKPKKAKAKAAAKTAAKKTKPSRRATSPKARCRELAGRYMGNPRAGVSAFKGLIATSPKVACAYKNLGAFQLRIGDDRGALEAYSQYLDLNPRAPDRRAVEVKIKSLRRRTRP